MKAQREAFGLIRPIGDVETGPGTSSSAAQETVERQRETGADGVPDGIYKWQWRWMG